MKTAIILLLFLIFFSGINLSKERKLWIGYSLGDSGTRHDGFVFVVTGETREDATKIFIRARNEHSGFTFKILDTGTDYDIWEITDSIIHKK